MDGTPWPGRWSYSGVVIVANPNIGFTTLAILVGIGFILNGLGMVALGWGMRGLREGT